MTTIKIINYTFNLISINRVIMDRHKCMAVLFLFCCALHFYTDIDILSYFNLNARIEESRNNVKIEEMTMQHHKKNKEEINKFDEHKSGKDTVKY